MILRFNIKTAVCVILCYTLVFCSPLGESISLLNFIDEIIPMFFFPLLFLKRNSKIHISKNATWAIGFLFIFLLSGILGNIIYQYQISRLVLIDLLTNFKFFLTIGFSFLFFYSSEKEKNAINFKTILWHLKFISLTLFIIFLVDRLFVIWPGEIRYGISSAMLFWPHSTYFAGALCFLISALLMLYEKGNIMYILIDVIMMVFTLRSKAIAAAFVCLLLMIYNRYFKGKLKIWHLGILGILSIIVGWRNISFYYIQLSGRSARSVMTQTAFKILKDYFPIGTGFATYGSHSAAVNYSKVYLLYGFHNSYELRGDSQSFMDDTFWPIILGQSGFAGTLAYILVLIILFQAIWKLQDTNKSYFMAGTFCFLYLLISSVAEPAFNNLVAIPLAVIIGFVLSKKKY